MTEGHVEISYGPLEIGVHVCGEKEAVEVCAQRSSGVAKRLLGEVLNFLPILKLKGRDIKVKYRWPGVVRRMIEAVQQIDPATLTPMAAVAGAIADELLMDLEEGVAGSGVSSIVINNGGDMAIDLRDAPINVGIRGAWKKRGDMRRIQIDRALSPFGVATSGWRGRSFSQGIADVVVAVAASGAVADAAATYLGNHVNDESIRNVKKCRAVELDPETDIPDTWVTISCGTLKEHEKRRALQNGEKMAWRLAWRGLIFGAGMYLQGESVEVVGVKGIIFN